MFNAAEWFESLTKVRLAGNQFLLRSILERNDRANEIRQMESVLSQTIVNRATDSYETRQFSYYVFFVLYLLFVGLDRAQDKRYQKTYEKLTGRNIGLTR